MKFADFWAGIVKRNPAFANEDTTIKIKIKTIKALVEQAHAVGCDVFTAPLADFFNTR